MFMRIRDLSAWLRDHAILGPGCYLAGATMMGALAFWAFTETMTGILRATDLVQPRGSQVSTTVTGIAATAGAVGAPQPEPARQPPAQPAEAESPRLAAIAQPARTLNNPADDPMAMYVDGSGDTYRTVCVRLCDGYFWPISLATDRSNLVHDREQCEKSCGSPARLYIHRVPGGSSDDMQDLAGQPYSRLRTAFRFRSTYDAQCKCTAHPWEQEAKDRHGVYALEAEARKGDRRALAALPALRSKVEADRRNELQQKRAANAQLVASGVVSAASQTAAGPPPSGRSARYTYSTSPQRTATRQDFDDRASRLGGPGMGGGSSGASPFGTGAFSGGSGSGRGSGGGGWGGGGFSGGGSGDWRARAFGFSN